MASWFRKDNAARHAAKKGPEIEVPRCSHTPEFHKISLAGRRALQLGVPLGQGMVRYKAEDVPAWRTPYTGYCWALALSRFWLQGQSPVDLDSETKLALFTRIREAREESTVTFGGVAGKLRLGLSLPWTPEGHYSCDLESTGSKVGLKEVLMQGVKALPVNGRIAFILQAGGGMPRIVLYGRNNGPPCRGDDCCSGLRHPNCGLFAILASTGSSSVLCGEKQQTAKRSLRRRW